MEIKFRVGASSRNKEKKFPGITWQTNRVSLNTCIFECREKNSNGICSKMLTGLSLNRRLQENCHFPLYSVFF